MSHQGRIVYFFTVFIVYFCISCTQDNNRDGAETKYNAKTNILTNYSKKVAGPEYDKVYQAANDSLESWVFNSLSAFKYCKLFPCG